MQSGRRQLRAWIERAKLNQTKTADLLGVSDVLISQWLNGVRTPSLELAVKIQDQTGIPAGSWVLSAVPNVDLVESSGTPNA